VDPDYPHEVLAALRAFPSEDPGHLFNRGVILSSYFQESGQRRAIDEALTLFRTAASRIPPGHPRSGMVFTGLVTCYVRRFDAFGETRDLAEAVNWADKALGATPPGNDDRPDVLTQHGLAYLTRYERFGDRADLEQAIRSGTEAARRAGGHPRCASLLSNAALPYRARFNLTGAEADLAEVIRYAEAAVRATDPDDPGIAQYLGNLGAAYQLRFIRFGDPADVGRAIGYWQRAERASTSRLDHPVMLSALGLAFRMRFEQTGADADLDTAIRYSVQAAEEAPEGHAAYPGVVSNCSVAYKLRFERFQDRGDLDRALRYARRAVAAMPDGHPQRAKYLGGLVGIYYALFQETGSTGYLDEAIWVGGEGLEAGTLAQTELGLALSDLGLMYRVRYEQNAAPADLDLAIKYGSDAVEETTAGHPERALRLCNLSLSYGARYALSGTRPDVDRALEHGRAAVDATPVDHPARAMFLVALARTHRARSERGVPGALDEAIGCWRAAVRSPVAPAHERLQAAIAWGRACEALADPALAAEGFAAAVGLLPLLAWRGLTRSLREKHLADYGGLVTDAAGWAIAAGNLENALELLEQGRSVLWSQSLQLRTDLTRLRVADAGLAARLEEVRAALDRPPGPVAGIGSAPGADDWDQEVVAGRQRELAREWDGLVQRARALPGMDTFLAATPYRRLREAASGGPVIVVNIGNHRCDALIITTRGVRLRPLPGLTAQECSGRATTLLGALEPPAPADEDELVAQRKQLIEVLFATMGWLWDTTCEPVLSDLRAHGDRPDGHPAKDNPVSDNPVSDNPVSDNTASDNPVSDNTATDNTALPRIWWCPTGPLTLLPLHAAGHYGHGGDSGGPCLPQLAVSSYTPTVEALLRSRERARPETGTRLLAVGMPTTPDFGRLRFAALAKVPAELDGIAAALPGVRVRLLRSPTRAELEGGALPGQQPTVDQVSRELAAHPWVHFACHGGQDLLDPSQGALYLTDGPLTVLRLGAAQLPAAELAFLSACQTAVGGVRVPDEAIHLAAALQFAGYRHVIATAWTISDSDAPQVAAAAYTELAATGSLRAGLAATAIHRAVAALRAAKPRRPDLWAPYLHIGP
jgi:tetratricopeptide (TPR) repeat protein